jgi:hypothetical protein
MVELTTIGIIVMISLEVINLGTVYFKKLKKSECTKSGVKIQMKDSNDKPAPNININIESHDSHESHNSSTSSEHS